MCSLPLCVWGGSRALYDRNKAAERLQFFLAANMAPFAASPKEPGTATSPRRATGSRRYPGREPAMMRP